MGDLYEYAKSEMNRQWPRKDDDEWQALIKENVLEIVKVFSDQGHSGSSAPYVVHILKRLLMWLPLGPLTGEEDEWSEPFGEDMLQQNKRCGSIFREYHDNNKAYNIRGKVFSDDGGETWWSNKDSHVPITFPYEVPDQPEYIIIQKNASEEKHD